MGIILATLGFVLLVIGMVGAFVPVLPGPPLSYIGLLLIQRSGYSDFSTAFMWIWAGIAVVVTVMDYVLPSLMSKWFGGSRAASIGSFLGLILGIFLFPPWGMVIGSFLGAFIGELIHSSADGFKAFKAGLGAFLAFIAGTGAKLAASGMMLYYGGKVVFSALWNAGRGIIQNLFGA